MARKSFFSSFYGKIINPDDPRYWEIVKIESLRKYVDMLESNCTCFECKRQKEKLHQYILTNILKIKNDKKESDQNS